MCERSELCELSLRDALESLRAKSVMCVVSGVARYLEKTYEIGVILHLSGQGCRLSPLFHQDDQDDQIN
jgi:hypothetical protein